MTQTLPCPHSATDIENQKLNDILNDLYRYYDQEIELTLDRLYTLLEKLGNPHLHLPPVIHVAGTNGKGSTLAALRSLLEADGRTVHMATSPHLVHPTERLILNSQQITTTALIALLEEVKAVNRNAPITFFEFFMAASFLAMSRVSADIVLLETGMGGRYDASNVIPNPLCTIITTISMDHAEFLGSTLTDIAKEKAGIIKAGVPCILGYQTKAGKDAQVEKVFTEISQSLSPVAPLYQAGADWRIAQDTHRLTFTWQDESYDIARPNLCGRHQVRNIGAALAAYRLIQGDCFDAKNLSPDAQNNSLLTIHWPGRLQRLDQKHPYCQLIPDTNEIWIDGGHNDSAGIALAQQAKLWQEEDGKPLHIILAMVNRKDPTTFITPLIPIAESITVTTIPSEDMAYDIDSLAKKLQPLGIKALHTAQTPQEALIQLYNFKQSRILLTGSLYFMGHILGQTSSAPK